MILEKQNPKLVLYIHGKGGNADEANYYKKFFDGWDVYGFDYKSANPWDAQKEFTKKIQDLATKYTQIVLIAGSIGAYFAMNAHLDKYIEKAFFISPIANLEKLILNMISWAGTSESELKKRKIIPVDFGDDLSWEYLQYVRNHKISWTTPTEILYGSADNLQSLETIQSFVNATSAGLTIMDGGEHWFHTDEQLSFLDAWLKSKIQ